MQYCGGKAKIGRKIAAILNPIIRDKGIKTYWEPFVGACGVMRYIEAPTRIGTDIDPDIIGLWQAMQAGWDPPSVVTEENYHKIKADPGSVDAATRAFVAWGCSFSGRKWGGYARGKQNYVANARNALLKILPYVQDVRFCEAAFHDLRTMTPWPMLIYCDPPYSGTTGGSKAFLDFDHARFWTWAEGLTAKGHVVFVSEYSGPPTWGSVYISGNKSTLTAGRNGQGKVRIERLFFKAAG